MPAELHDFTDYNDTRRRVYDGVTSALQEKYPVENDRYRLELGDLSYSGPEDFSLKDQKDAILQRRSIYRPLKGTWRLFDKATNTPVDEHKGTIMHVPHLTSRGTYILRGNEYTVANQMRLRSGVYARQKENGELESHFNVLRGGPGFRLFMEPKTGVFRMEVGQAKLKMYPILHSMGVTDAEMMKWMGPDLFRANVQEKKDPGTLRKVWERMANTRARKEIGEYAPGKEDFAALFSQIELDPDVTERTLGKKYGNVTPEVLLRSMQKLININAGKETTDDRDSLAYQETWSADDFFKERIRKDAGMIASRALWKATLRGNLKHMASGALNPQIDAVFFKSGVATPLEEINPMDALDQNMRVTRLGEGGLSSERVTAEARNVNPSQFMFIDPIRSPESGSIGVDTRVTVNTLKGNDRQLYTAVRNMATGKTEYLPPGQIVDATVAFPGEIAKARKEGRKYVKAMVGGTMQFAKMSDIQYEAPTAQGLFTQGSNMVPLVSAIKGGRLLMGAKMIAQALPLSNPEAPLVMTRDADGQSFYDKLSTKMGAVKAVDSGVVTRVSKNSITVQQADNTVKKYELYDNFPMNRKSVTGDTEICIRRGTDVFVTRFDRYVYQDGDQVQSIDPDTKMSAWMPVTGYMRHVNDKRLYRITTASKRSFTVTEDHSLMTMGSDGELVPVYPGVIVPGRDRVPVAMLPLCAADDNNSDAYNTGVLDGLYLSEGCLPVDSNLLNIAVAPIIRAEYVLRLLKELGYTTAYRCGSGGTSPSVCVTDKDLHTRLERTFGHYSHMKTIPDSVLNASVSYRRGLIAGYFAGDGSLWADSNGAVQLTAVSVSKGIRDGIVRLLSGFGIFTSLFDMSNELKSDAWRHGYGLRVCSCDILKLETWFAYPDRQQKLCALLEYGVDTASKYAMVPVPDNAARKLLYTCIGTYRPRAAYKSSECGCINKRHLVSATGVYGQWGRSDVVWETITTIQEVATEPYVYDISVDRAEAFAVALGVVVHNTFLSSMPQVKAGDAIRPGQLLAGSNYTDKNGTVAIGKNLKTAYLPYRGFNYEDAVVISETAAKKLSSEHMYTEKMDLSNMTGASRNKFLAMFPSTYTREQLDRIDEDGVIRPGSRIVEDDPLILAVQRRTSKGAGMLYHGAKQSYKDASATWQHSTPGIVTDVWRDKTGVKVAVKTYAPSAVGDKISGRFGDKNIISAVIPDDQMPVDEEGLPLEVLLNPLGVISRGNPAQMMEAILGKIAKKRGKPYNLDGFSDDDLVEFTIKEMESNGVKDTEDLYDPTTHRKIPGVLTGSRYMLKLHHIAESKVSGRALGAYTSEGMPSKGEGEDNPKRVGTGEMQALLSHGAIETIKDIKNVRGQKNDAYWRAMSLGYPPPSPEMPPMYKKFMSLMRAAGINTKKKGNYIHLTAMTDKDVTAMSSGEIKNPETVRWLAEYGRGAFGEKSLDPIDGGLFDRGITGSHGGTRWSHINLSEPMPQPAMEDPIRNLLDLTKAQYMDIIAGKSAIPGAGTGGKGIFNALSRIKIPTELERLEQEIRSATSAARRDKAVKKLGYLRAMDSNGTKPSDLVITKIPVLPPIFRPITATDKFNMVAGVNLLYMDLMHADKNLKEMSDAAGADSEMSNSARLNVYNAVKAVTGLGDPIKPERRLQNIHGVLGEVFGNSPKFGQFQRKLLGTSVDLAGRATITPNPSLDMDQIGLPEDQAWKLYGPFVVRRLVKAMGNEPDARTQAVKMVANREPRALRELELEMEQRPVLSSRAPALHRYSIMAFKPVISKGNTLQVSPAIVTGFNADFDGNCVDFDTELIITLSQSAIDNYTELGYIFTDAQKMKGDCQMKVVATSMVVVGDDTTTVYMKIGNFPRTGVPVKDKNGADVYGVPDGVKVLSYDFETGAPVFKPVNNLTVEQDSECALVKIGSREVIISTNESMCVFDAATGALAKVTPQQAAGKFVPVIVRDPTAYGNFGNRDLGWWIGSYLSDGWITKYMVGYAKTETIKREEFVRVARREITENFTVHEYSHDGSNALGAGVKLHISGDLASKIAPWHMSEENPEGCRQALTKQIPLFMLYTGCEDFLWGLLSGLIDGDGSLTKNMSTGKARFGVRLSTSSTALKDTMCVLLFRLGLQYSVTTSPPRGTSNEAYSICVSSEDLSAQLSKLTCVGEREKALISEWMLNPSEGNGMHDMIPLSVFEAKELAVYALAIKDMSAYSSMKKATGVEAKLSRKSLRRLMLGAGGRINGSVYRSVRARIDSPVHWYKVDKLTPAGRRAVFDLAVEDTKIFAVNNGLIVYDTMNFHVVVSPKAVEEAKRKLLPSRNLRSPADFGTLWAPRQEFLQGLYAASTRRSGRKSLPKYKSPRDVIAAFNRGDVDVDDVVSVDD